MQVLLALLAASAVQAAILHVPADYPNIPAAFAASGTGDQILVAPGVYTGNLVFPAHAVQLRATDGPATTTLQVVSGSVVTFQSGQNNSTVLEGFSITGGTGTPVNLNGVQRGGVGGGVFCRNGSSPIIRGNWIYDNSGVWPQSVGGGIFAWSSSPLIEHNWIRSNVAFYGGGIFFQSSSGVIRDNIIEDNDTMPNLQGGKGGGVRILWGSPTIEGNTFVGNHCHWVGSAMAFSESGTTVAVTRNLLVGNSGSYPIDIAYSAWGNLACNLQWANTPSNSWPVTGYWSNQGGNGYVDPLFCDGTWPYKVVNDSPCLPGQNPFGSDCGWIGATQELCGVVVEADDDLPQTWQLGAPWPNPFNPIAHVTVLAAELAPVKLQLISLRGELVATLHAGLLEAGQHEFEVDGSRLASGLYLLRLESPDGAQVRKVSLIR